MLQKKCAKCKQDKSLEDFSSRPEGKLKLRSHCKQCESVKRKKHRQKFHKRKNSDIDIPIVKKCKHCGFEKKYFEFSKNKTMLDGLNGRCKQCCVKDTQAYHHTINGFYSQYKNNAKRRGYVFEISKEEFQILKSKPCHYCGEQSSGIDRKNNTIGYIVGNCLPCCAVCNRMKMNLEYNHFLNKCKQICHKLFN